MVTSTCIGAHTTHGPVHGWSMTAMPANVLSHVAKDMDAPDQTKRHPAPSLPPAAVFPLSLSPSRSVPTTQSIEPCRERHGCASMTKPPRNVVGRPPRARPSNSGCTARRTTSRRSSGCAYVADTPSPSTLKHLLKAEGSAAEWQQNDSLADGLGASSIRSRRRSPPSTTHAATSATRTISVSTASLRSAIWCHSLTFHCLSLTFHRLLDLPLPFLDPSTAFPLPFLDPSTTFPLPFTDCP